MLRSLIHYWRVHLAVAAGTALATAVLGGALVVGDSVRGSLRQLTLERLGNIERSLVAPRFVRAALADEIGAAPAIVLQGSAVHAGTESRASRVAVHGVDARFLALFPGEVAPALERAPDQIFPSLLINAALARELAARPGDDVLLRFGRSADVPRDSLLGERDPGAVLGTLRVRVTRVLDGEGPSRFGLVPHQGEPLVAYVALEPLQRALREPGRVNALFTAVGTGADPNLRWREIATWDDLGLRVRSGGDHFAVESRELVLRPNVAHALAQAAAAVGAPAQPVQTYLANRLRAGDRVVPYSTVAALQPGDAPWSMLQEEDGGAVPRIAADEILLNRWAAEDLGVRPGASIELAYFEVGPREELVEREVRLRLGPIVALEGLGADPTLTPELPGVSDAADMSGWEPPFPVDLSLIRSRDEDYWDRWRALPKGFVAPETGDRLWTSRFGRETSLRVGAAPGLDLAATEERVREALLDTLSPQALGLAFREVRAEGLRAADGATDFAGLFLGFSLFLIAAAALLVALLFGLGVERRAREIGLLLAVGHPLGRVRRCFLAEGAMLAAGGGVLGVGLAVGYAAAMVAGLRTLWLPAVGSSRLELHVAASSLVIGFGASMLVVLVAIRLRLRALGRTPPVRLLAGSFRVPRMRGRVRWRRRIAWGAAALGIALFAVARLGGREESPLLAFSSGTALLVGGLAGFSAWLDRERSGLVTRAPLAGMAARNGAWNPGRSVLSVALVGAACFVIAAVAASRRELGEDVRTRDSGSGGFALVAESQVALHQSLSRPEDLGELGFDAAQAARLSETAILPFRLLPGDDTSCLNLYRPERPRIVGVPRELVERGGFRFRATSEPAANPWELLARPGDADVIPAFADFNSATWILKLGLGEELPLQDEAGREVRLRLVGLLDTSVFQSEILVAESSFLHHFPGRGGYRYFLIDPPLGKEDEIAGLLEERLAPFGFDVTSARDKLASYQVVEHTYLATFQLLGGLGLLLGTVGLGVVMLRNVIERRGELATLRAFGFRRSRLGWLVLLETAFLLATGIAVGTAAAFVAVAPRIAAAHTPWASLGLLLVGVFAVGLVSCLAATRSALRAPLLPELKAE